MTTQTYLEPTQESGRALFVRGIPGPVVMLNLLRFRSVADYSANPELAPTSPISGEAAYRLYMAHTLPYLHASGGEILFYGKGGSFLIARATSAGTPPCSSANPVSRRSLHLHPTKAIYRAWGIALRARRLTLAAFGRGASLTVHSRRGGCG